MNQNRTHMVREEQELPTYRRVIVEFTDGSAREFEFSKCNIIPCANGAVVIVNETRGEKRQHAFVNPQVIKGVDIYPATTVQLA